MAEYSEDILNSLVMQIISWMVATGQISPQMALDVLNYLYDLYGDEIFNY